MCITPILVTHQNCLVVVNWSISYNGTIPTSYMHCAQLAQLFENPCAKNDLVASALAGSSFCGAEFEVERSSEEAYLARHDHTQPRYPFQSRSFHRDQESLRLCYFGYGAGKYKGIAPLE
jgi:hypothetical protein